MHEVTKLRKLQVISSAIAIGCNFIDGSDVQFF